MQTFEVPGNELQKMLHNVIKFSVEKAVHLPGVILFSLTDGWLRCYTTDDYVAFSDQVSTNVKFNLEFVLSLNSVKDLYAYAKDNKKYPIVFEVSDVSIFCRIATDPGAEYARLPISHKWDVVHFNIHSDEPEVHPVTNFAFAYERLQKFYSLGINAPIDFESVMTEHAGLVLRFKIGENILGCISPLRREIIAKEHPEYLWEGSY